MSFQPVRTMTATIAAEMGEVAQGSMHYHVLFGIGIRAVSRSPLPSIRWPGGWSGRQNARRRGTHDETPASTKNWPSGSLPASPSLVVLPIVLVILYIFVKGIGAISWEFLTAGPRDGMTEGGIMPAILGTLILTLGTAIVCMPLAIGAAIYLAEYAGDNRLTRWVRLAIVNLAGIPSIVYGLFGLGAFVLFLNLGTSIIAGSLTLGIMTLPVIISTAEEAIRAVPQEFRVVSQSLGATRWQTIRHQVLPHAVPGIITGMILGLSRAAGRNGADPVHRRGVLSARSAALAVRSDDGAALSPVRDFDPGARHAALDPVWHGPGAAVAGPVADAGRHDHPHPDAPPPGLVGEMSMQPKISSAECILYLSTTASRRCDNVSLDIQPNEIFVLFGPSRSGKTTLLRLFNRLSDLVEKGKYHGTILFNGQDVFERGMNVTDLRRRIGMVFAVPTPLPGSIRDNLIYGPSMAGMRDRTCSKSGWNAP